MVATPWVVNIGDLALDGRSGVLWGFASEQQNANFVMLDEGESMLAHRNDEVDVIIVVQSGDGEIVIDGSPHPLAAGSIAVVPRGTVRSIQADRRLLYFTIHQRRDGPLVGNSAGV